MRRFLAAQFAPVLRAWRNGYEAEVRRAAIAFFLLVFLAFGVCLAVPELRLGFSAYLQHLFPALALGVNAVLLGGLAACYAATDTTMLLYAASLLPHGIFELPALILAFSMGLYICGHLTRRCRRDPAALPLGACLGLAARLLVFLLLPLLILAALTEAYVTPLAAGLFL